MPLSTIRCTEKNSAHVSSVETKEQRSASGGVSSVLDENSPPPSSLVDELKIIGGDFGDPHPVLTQSLECQDEPTSSEYAPFIAGEPSDNDFQSRFGDVPQSTSLSKPLALNVPSECIEDGYTGCDESFWVEELSDNDVADTSQDPDHEFRSELFFVEEESSRASDAFDPDLQSSATECAEHAAPSLTESARPIPGLLRAPDRNSHLADRCVGTTARHCVPVKCVQVCDHTFNGPTLRMRRLFYLRQMHILMELGKVDAFGHERPLIHPVLHAAPSSRGLGWAAEHGVVGGWADVDRPEPRYITHFRGRPSLLFAEERAIISKASRRAILSVGQIDVPVPEM